MKNFMEFNIKKVFDYRTIKFGVCHLKTSFGQFELISLHEKSFFFLKTLWKQGLSKKFHWNIIFPLLSGIMVFNFPENMILLYRWKMKDNLSWKKCMEVRYFLQMLWKDGLFKKIVLEYDLSCIIWKDGIFFPENMIFFLCTENER